MGIMEVKVKNKVLGLLMLAASIAWLTKIAYGAGGPWLLDLAIYGAYFIFIAFFGAKEAVWSAISLPLGYVFFLKGAGASFLLTAALSSLLAALTLVFLPWVLYRG